MLKQMPFAFLIVVTTTALVSGQLEGNRPSSQSSAQCELPGGKTLGVKYSSPSTVDRNMTLVTEEALVTASGKNVPPGSYTILTVPDSDKWTLVINDQTPRRDGKSEELARVPMYLKKLNAPVQNVQISFDRTAIGCTMHVISGRTEASVDFNVKNSDLPVIR